MYFQSCCNISCRFKFFTLYLLQTIDLFEKWLPFNYFLYAYKKVDVSAMQNNRWFIMRLISLI